jgi:predicted nucleic acid-binding protein
VSFLLDTNVVSEWVKPEPDPGVVAWLADADEDRLFLSVATLAEIKHGVERMAEGRRRDRLSEWLADELPARFEGRLLAIDERVAEAWGVVMARSQRAGVGLGAMDAFFAATAEVHGLTLVTRDGSDFCGTSVDVLDPWQTRI